MEYFLKLGTFAMYMALMLAIGILFAGKSGNLGTYYLGGRKMNKWVVAMSAQASDMSGWLLMGLPGAIYLSGLCESWIGIGLGIGTYLNWKIVARRLRVYSHICGDSITIPDFLSNRFRDKSGLMRMIAALIILFFFLFYSASGFVSCAKLFTAAFGNLGFSEYLLDANGAPVLDAAGKMIADPTGYRVALLIGVAVIVSYTLMGGYMAVCWTDLIQGILMFLAIVIIPAIIFCQLGGFQETINAVNADNCWLLNAFTNAKTGKAVSSLSIISSLAWGLGYFGMPHILVRFMSIKRADEITESRRIAMGWVVISLGAAVLVGVLGNVFAHRNGLEVNDAEKIFMLMCNTIFSGTWYGAVIIGLLLSAILAAIMSTADSQLLVSASAFSNDIYRYFIRKNASEKELIRISRITVAVVAIIAALMALNGESDFVKTVMTLVSFAWGGFGAAFGPVVILALFWRRININGAASGMVVGALVSVIWKFVLAARFPDVELFKLYELVPGFVLSFAVVVIVSLLSAPPSKELCDEFDSVAESRSV